MKGNSEVARTPRQNRKKIRFHRSSFIAVQSCIASTGPKNLSKMKRSIFSDFLVETLKKWIATCTMHIVHVVRIEVIGWAKKSHH